MPMALRNTAKTEAVIAKRLREGRGQGRGADYKPWLDVQQVPSLGLSERIKGWKSNRVHHLFSQLEVNYFYALEWSESVTDIREQYPLLPLDETLDIAQACGFTHPKAPRTNQPIVMTTDFLVTIGQSMGVTEVARTVKPSGKLQEKRILEKFEIERRYWENRNISWGIVTEQEIPSQLAKNVKWLHPFFCADALSLSEREISHIQTLLTHKVHQTDASLGEIAADCDDRMGLLPGSSLSVARHLLATRQWLVDMNQPIEPRKKLVLLSQALEEPPPQIGEVG